MESKCCSWFQWNEDDCRLSASCIFFDFITKNMAMPSDLGELVAYVFLLVISWYALLFAFRFLLSLVKPVLIVVAALYLFRFLRTTDIKDLITQSSSLVMNGVYKAVELFMHLLD